MSYTVMRPLRHKALVRLDPKAKTHGDTGIVIPDLWQKQPERATVISVGPEAHSEVVPGARVFVYKWAGVEVEPPDGALPGEYRVVNTDPDRKFGDGLNTSQVSYQDIAGLIVDE